MGIAGKRGKGIKLAVFVVLVFLLAFAALMYIPNSSITGMSTLSATACSGYCNGKAPSGCYCDSACKGYGDCCAGFDYASMCGGAQPAAAVSAAMTQYITLFNPSIEPVSSTTAKVHLSWTKFGGSAVVKYSVYRKTGNTSADNFALISGSMNDMLSVTDPVISKGVNYSYYVYAYDTGAKKETQSNVVSIVWPQPQTPPNPAPAQPPANPPVQPPAPTNGSNDSAPPVNSCSGYCNGKAPSGCYCDSVCSKYGDCCAGFDYASTCGSGSGPSPPSPPNATNGTNNSATPPANMCFGYCNSKHPAGCYCDSLCKNYGDCCAGFDYATTCGAGGSSVNQPPANPPVTPNATNNTTPPSANTCSGYCNGKAPSGCYCDSVCSKYGDCCAGFDYSAMC